MPQSKEDRSEYFRAYRVANKEKIVAKQKAYRLANKEKVAEYKKAYRVANKEKVSEHAKVWYEENHEERIPRHHPLRILWLGACHGWQEKNQQQGQTS